MSFLNTLTNNRVAKGAVGGTLNALPGYSSLGANISNPSVNYQGQPNPQPQQNFTINSGDGGAYARAHPSGGVLGANIVKSGPLADPAGDADRAAALFGIDQSLTGARDSLGRLDGQLNTGYGNIDRDYQHQYDILAGNRSRNNARYDQQGTAQLTEYQAKRSNNNTGAANWLQAARRTVGANGAGGGSAARYALPFDAETQATTANSADQAVNTRNMAAIAGSRQADEDQFINAENDLGYQRDTGRRDLLSNILNTRATLQNQIGGLEGQRAIANGGDFKAAQAAANPYTSKISALLDQIDNLSVTPTIKAQQVTTGRPDLSGYNWARPETAPQAVQDPTLQGNQIVYPGQDDKRRNPLAALFGLA
jgi:hypothetical protein